MRKYIVYLLAFGLLLGCATTDKFTSVNDLKDFGIVVGRFPTLDHYFVFQKLVPDFMPSAVAKGNTYTEFSAGSDGTAAGFKVKEGTYYIERIIGNSSSLLGTTKYLIDVPLELRQPIVIKKGMVLYIGSFSYNMGGLFQKSSVQFSTSMAGVADELAQKYPALKNTTITSLFE